MALSLDVFLRLGPSGGGDSGAPDGRRIENRIMIACHASQLKLIADGGLLPRERDVALVLLSLLDDQGLLCVVEVLVGDLLDFVQPRFGAPGLPVVILVVGQVLQLAYVVLIDGRNLLLVVFALLLHMVLVLILHLLLGRHGHIGLLCRIEHLLDDGVDVVHLLLSSWVLLSERRILHRNLIVLAHLLLGCR